MKTLRFLVAYAAMMMAAAHATPPPADTVVLLHGLGRTSASMWRIAGELERSGYRVVNATYSTLRQPLETVATEWLPAKLREIEPGSRVHFVTHSMGGILVRLWLRECGAPANLGRVVMLAPPNAGSEIPDRLGGFAPLRWLTGPNAHRLGTGVGSLPRALGPWPAEAGLLGVIAGDASLHLLPERILPGPHDGKVSVAATHLAGESDHLTLHFSHTWLIWRRETIAQVTSFLRDGVFAHATTTP